MHRHSMASTPPRHNSILAENCAQGLGHSKSHSDYLVKTKTLTSKSEQILICLSVATPVILLEMSQAWLSLSRRVKTQ